MSLKRTNPVRETEPKPSLPGTLHKPLHIVTAWLSRHYNIKCAFNKWSKLIGAEDFRGRWLIQAWMNWWGRNLGRPCKLDQRQKWSLWLWLSWLTVGSQMFWVEKWYLSANNKHTQKNKILWMEGKIVKQFKTGL